MGLDSEKVLLLWLFCLCASRDVRLQSAAGTHAAVIILCASERHHDSQQLAGKKNPWSHMCVSTSAAGGTW